MAITFGLALLAEVLVLTYEVEANTVGAVPLVPLKEATPSTALALSENEAVTVYGVPLAAGRSLLER